MLKEHMAHFNTTKILKVRFLPGGSSMLKWGFKNKGRGWRGGIGVGSVRKIDVLYGNYRSHLRQGIFFRHKMWEQKG